MSSKASSQLEALKPGLNTEETSILSNKSTKENSISTVASQQSNSNKNKTKTKKSNPLNTSQQENISTNSSDNISNITQKRVQVANQSNVPKQPSNASKNAPQIKATIKSSKSVAKNNLNYQQKNQESFQGSQISKKQKNVEQSSNKSKNSNLPTAKSAKLIKQDKQKEIVENPKIQRQKNKNDIKKTDKKNLQQSKQDNSIQEIILDKSEKKERGGYFNKLCKNVQELKNVDQAIQKYKQNLVGQDTQKTPQIKPNHLKQQKQPKQKQISLQNRKQQSQSDKDKKPINHSKSLAKNTSRIQKNLSKTSKNGGNQENRLSSKSISKKLCPTPTPPDCSIITVDPSKINEKAFMKNKSQPNECSIQIDCLQQNSISIQEDNNQKIVALTNIDVGPQTFKKPKNKIATEQYIDPNEFYLRNKQKQEKVKFFDEVKNKTHQTVKKLGSGQYATVYLTKDNYAIKQIDMTFLSDKHQQLLNSEIKCMEKLKHKNIVKFISQFQIPKAKIKKQLSKTEQQNEKQLPQKQKQIIKIQVDKKPRKQYIVMQYCKSNLSKQLFDQTNKPLLTQRQAMKRFGQILEGYNQLYINSIVHRDLKPDNILIGMDNQCKIADFGFSKIAQQQNQKFATIAGTPYFQAPQLLRGLKYTYKCDIWSLGVLLYYMLSAQFPWPARNVHQLLQSIKKTPISQILQNQQEQKFSYKTKVMIIHMLRRYPQDRIQWTQLYDLFFSDIYPEPKYIKVRKPKQKKFVQFKNENNQTVYKQVSEIMGQVEQNQNQVQDIRNEVNQICNQQPMTITGQLSKLSQMISRQTDVQNVQLGDVKTVKIKCDKQQKNLEITKQRDNNGGLVNKQRIKKRITIQIVIQQQITLNEENQNDEQDQQN